MGKHRMTSMKNHGIKLFEVGGCVRDDLLGLSSKDVDFAVQALSFEQMGTPHRPDGVSRFSCESLNS